MGTRGAEIKMIVIILNISQGYHPFWLLASTYLGSLLDCSPASECLDLGRISRQTERAGLSMSSLWSVCHPRRSWCRHRIPPIHPTLHQLEGKAQIERRKELRLTLWEVQLCPQKGFFWMEFKMHLRWCSSNQKGWTSYQLTWALFGVAQLNLGVGFRAGLPTVGRTRAVALPPSGAVSSPTGLGAGAERAPCGPIPVNHNWRKIIFFILLQTLLIIRNLLKLFLYQMLS